MQVQESRWIGYEAACRDYDERWSLVDEMLYALCRAHPRHVSIGEVTAKVAIVGRTYNAGIERQVTGDNLQSGTLQRVVECLLTRGREVDALIDELTVLCEPLDIEDFAKVAPVHGAFVQILHDVTRQQRSARSFASKFLHFHNPVVPIYDGYAARILQRLFARQRVPSIPGTDGVDGDYAWYVARFWQIYQEARESQERVSVKLVDHYLLSTS